MFYEFIRKLTCPYNLIEKYVPETGKILEVGCGHGLFSKLVAEKNSKRIVVGIDPSVKKINMASRDNHLPNLSFKASYLENIKDNYNCITIIDILYLLPPDEKLKIFTNAQKNMNQGGKLIVVENGDGKELIFRILKLQEILMTKIFKFTYSDYQKLYFLDKQGYRDLIKKAGFTVELEKELKSAIPYPHFILVAKAK